MSVSYLCAVGIDLGTKFSSIGRFDSIGNIFLINDKVNSSVWIPSVVSYAMSEVRVGTLALEYQRRYPKDVIVDAKRMIGRYYDDNIIQEWKKKCFFEIESDCYRRIRINTSQGYKTPVEVIRDIIKYLLELAREYSGDKRITHAVVSVPANYNTFQREETKRAAELAGLEVVHLINEPTAGIISHWFSNYGDYASNRGKNTVLVYDFGGGTLDVSLAQVSDESIEVVAVSGEMDVGGCDIDNNLVDYYLKELGATDIKQEITKKGRIGERARTYLRKITNECQKAKISFSKFDKETIIDPEIDLERFGSDESEITITKSQFYSINKNIIGKLTRPIDDVFKEAQKKSLNITKDNLTDVILIGGSSYNKFVIERLSQYFKKMKILNIDILNAVVKGAVIEAQRRFFDNFYSDPIHKSLEIKEVCPFLLGIAINRNKVLTIIKRNSKIPTSNEQTLFTVENVPEFLTIDIHENKIKMITGESYRGFLILDNLPKQEEKIKIILKLELDENCILHASVWVDGDRLNYYCDHIKFFTIAQEVYQPITPPRVPNPELQEKWRLLHENVISFIKKFIYEVDDRSIRESLIEIEEIANNKISESVYSKFDYNYMVNMYIDMFEEYNSTVSISKQTNFLRYI